VHEPNLGLALDIFHIFAGGRTDSDLNGIPVERVFLVQLSDLARGVAYRTVAETAQHHRLLPGDGRFPIQSILDRLRSEGYAGPIGVKAFNDCMRARPAVEVAREAMASLIRVWVR
jgi:4-hydroxyphenylpyruvate dioxygenase